MIAYQNARRCAGRLTWGPLLLAGCWLLALASSTTAAPPVTALALAPAGGELVVGSQAGVVVRSWPELELVRTLDTQLSAVHDIIFAPDGTQLALVGGTPGEVGGFELRSWPSGELVHDRMDFNDEAYVADWSAEGELAVAGEDLVIVYRGEQLDSSFVLAGHSRRVLATRFLPKTAMVVSAGIDQSLRVFDAAEGHSLRVLRNHTADVYDLAVRPGDMQPPMLASCAADRTVRFWQPTIGRMVRFARLDDAEPLVLSWTTDGARVVAACTDGRLRIINPQTASVEAVVPGCDGWIYDLAIDEEGLAVVGGTDGQLRSVKLELPPANP